MNWLLTLAGFIVGGVVGLTGMGGGALMTPILVLFFGVPPLAAVSNDLVVSAITKPVGSFVHLRKGKVNMALVRWLCLGSVPFAFIGVLIARSLGPGEQVQTVIKYALGIALIIASASLIVRSYLRLLERSRRRQERILGLNNQTVELVPVKVRPIPTVAIGAVGGLFVGMTSVGSGSLIIIALIFLYPSLEATALVGTDLVQAVPLVISAAVAHILFGDFQWGITLPLLLGTIPGVYLGARYSAHAPGGIVRRVLSLVLLASALKLLDVPNAATVAVLFAVVVIGPPVWMWARKRAGMPALARTEAAERNKDSVHTD